MICCLGLEQVGAGGGVGVGVNVNIHIHILLGVSGILKLVCSDVAQLCEYAKIHFKWVIYYGMWNIFQ